MGLDFQPKKRINYLSNKELLKEIHISKLSYCEFKNKKYEHYDLILTSIKEITPKIIAEAKNLRAEYINNKLLEEQLVKGISFKEANLLIAKKKIKAKQLKRSDLCFRIMTLEHIPREIAEDKKVANLVLSMPPFKHYSFLRGKWREVARSHWDGNFKTGKFNANKGQISNRLIRSLMTLVDRYSQRGNFRNYTYLDDMKGQALVQLSHAALKFDESKSDNPFAFYTTCIRHCFIKILKDEKKNRQIRDELLTNAGMSASYSFQEDFHEQEIISEH